MRTLIAMLLGAAGCTLPAQAGAILVIEGPRGAAVAHFAAVRGRAPLPAEIEPLAPDRVRIVSRVVRAKPKVRR